jgi:hypothetical protein
MSNSHAILPRLMPGDGINSVVAEISPGELVDKITIL